MILQEIRGLGGTGHIGYTFMTIGPSLSSDFSPAKPVSTSLLPPLPVFSPSNSMLSIAPGTPGLAVNSSGKLTTIDTNTDLTVMLDLSTPADEFFFKYSLAAFASESVGQNADLDNFIDLLLTANLKKATTINGIGSIGSWLKDQVNAIGEGISDAWNNLSDAAQQLAEKIWKDAIAAKNAIKAKLSQLQDYAKEKGPEIKDALQKLWDLTKKFAPPLLVARNAYLLLIEFNIWGYASLWYYGMIDDNAAALLNLSPEFREHAKQGYNHLAERWEAWGGSVSSLNKSIETGKDKKAIFDKKGNSKINGIGFEPAEISAAIVAAGTIIAALKGTVQAIRSSKGAPSSIITPGGEPNLYETGIDGNATIEEIQAAMSSLSSVINGSRGVIPDEELNKLIGERDRLSTLLNKKTAEVAAAEAKARVAAEKIKAEALAAAAKAKEAADKLKELQNGGGGNNPPPQKDPLTDETDDTPPWYTSTAGKVSIALGLTALGVGGYYMFKGKKKAA